MNALAATVELQPDPKHRRGASSSLISFFIAFSSSRRASSSPSFFFGLFFFLKFPAIERDQDVGCERRVSAKDHRDIQ
jgi:hypothetical protein